MHEGPTERKLKELIGIAVGEASMCWNPRPGNQVFDSTHASEVVDRLTCDILNIIADQVKDANQASWGWACKYDKLETKNEHLTKALEFWLRATPQRLDGTYCPVNEPQALFAYKVLSNQYE